MVRTLLLAALCVAVWAGGPSVEGAAGQTSVGVYAGGGNVTGAEAYGSWLGVPPTVVLDYLEWTTWNDIAQPIWLLDQWEDEPYLLVLSVPLLPSDGSTLAQGAAGNFDGHFTQLARNLVARGLGGSVVRLGWEFNHAWFPWYAGHAPGTFVAYWRRVVDAMRAVEGQSFTFDWSANLGGAVSIEDAYPGDGYVDTIGLDVYNHDWHPGWEDPVTRWNNLRTKSYGLDWHRNFAAMHGKPVSFPEWGMILRTDGHGGGDDPYFVERMHSWFARSNTAFQIYFDVDTAESTNSMTKGWFPRGALRYRELFGPAAASSPPPPGGGSPVRPPATPVNLPVTAQGWSVRAVVRRPKRRLKISVATAKGVPVRRVDVLVRGRRVCRDRQAPFRCAIRRLGPRRHHVEVRVIHARGSKTTFERKVMVGRKVRKPILLRS